MCLQDHGASNYNKQFILGHCNKTVEVNIPDVLYIALKKKSGRAPRSLVDFNSRDFVPTGAKCNCVLLRQKRSLGRDQCVPDESGFYPCSVCEREGGKNSHEVKMVNQVKKLVGARKEKFIVCVQVPVRGNDGTFRQKCDMILARCDATKLYQLLVIELDSTDHFEKPRQYGKSRDYAFNSAVKKDGEKNNAVFRSGMRLLRLNKRDMDSGCWVSELNAALDAL